MRVCVYFQYALRKKDIIMFKCDVVIVFHADAKENTKKNDVVCVCVVYHVQV